MYYKSQKRSSQNIDYNYRQSLCRPIYMFGGLSLCVVIVCILWVSFFSGRLDGADHNRFRGGYNFFPAMQTIYQEIL